MVQALRYNPGCDPMTPPEQCYNRIGRADQRLHSSTRLFFMFRFRQITLFWFIFSLLPGVLWAAPQKTQKPHTLRVKSSARQASNPVTPPAPPAPPPTLEQLPAQPPQVSYLNGQLTIISRNSTLSDILHAVARRTGADIELPPGAGFERVAGRMGPGPARNVLAELLNGSHYDYVMVASAANPGGLQHVILTPKTGGAVSPAPPAPVAANPPQAAADESEAPPDASADQQEIPPEAPSAEETPAPPSPSPYDHAEGDSSQSGNQPAPGVKTPQQLLQELQRMQQQQQQQQQNQPQ